MSWDALEQSSDWASRRAADTANSGDTVNTLTDTVDTETDSAALVGALTEIAEQLRIRNLIALAELGVDPYVEEDGLSKPALKTLATRGACGRLLLDEGIASALGIKIGGVS